MCTDLRGKFFYIFVSIEFIFTTYYEKFVEILQLWFSLVRSQIFVVSVVLHHRHWWF